MSIKRVTANSCRSGALRSFDQYDDVFRNLFFLDVDFSSALNVGLNIRKCNFHAVFHECTASATFYVTQIESLKLNLCVAEQITFATAVFVPKCVLQFFSDYY